MQVLPAQKIKEQLGTKFPGIAVSILIAVTATFLSEHYGAPAMLMALLLGIAVHFLSEEGKAVEGIEFSSTIILRIGVALLGARISVELLYNLGGALISLAILGVISTIIFGLAISRFTTINWRFALLTGGSVAICGASAAMAISAILPKDKNSEQNLIFTVLSVTILSTIAMIAYPIIVDALGFNAEQSGVFLGGTIHDVAQVVGAGFSVSNETGEVATLVKLIRVSMLAPVVLIASLLIRSVNKPSSKTEKSGNKTPLLPSFVVGFLILATLNSFGFIPEQISPFINSCSRWALLISISAVGMRTSIKKMLSVGSGAISLIIAETIFLAAFILLGMEYLN